MCAYDTASIVVIQCSKSQRRAEHKVSVLMQISDFEVFAKGVTLSWVMRTYGTCCKNMQGVWIYKSPSSGNYTDPSRRILIYITLPFPHPTSFGSLQTYNIKWKNRTCFFCMVCISLLYFCARVAPKNRKSHFQSRNIIKEQLWINDLYNCEGEKPAILANQKAVPCYLQFVLAFFCLLSQLITSHKLLARGGVTADHSLGQTLNANQVQDGL